VVAPACVHASACETACSMPSVMPARYCSSMPLYLPSHRALAFGDAVVEVEGELRVWATDRVDEKRVRFHRERFNPTLEPLLELDLERVLVTHGEPVLENGREKLRAAVKARPWDRRGWA